ncbi:hypothetical protein [Thermomonas fusca]|uniref:hypothetical protein n=1 Tax=Thermomonas fusca TaxID=215690 RepID=UPI0004019A16|nr:hypothetical protein [Thermomonas fusca]
MLYENAIVEPADKGIKWFAERAVFLGIDEAGHAVFMPLLTQTKGPEKVSFEAVKEALESGGLVLDATVRRLRKDPKELSPKAKSEYDFWEPHFRPIVTGEARGSLLETKGRARAIEQIAAATQRPQITVRRMLYKVLRAGCHLYGLCMDFDRRGAPGAKQKPGTNKRGRKPLPGGIASDKPASDFRPRIEAAVIDLVIGAKEKMRVAYRKFLVEDFTRTIKVSNGTVKTALVPESQRPTFKQFRVVAEEIQRKGVKKTRYVSSSAHSGTAKDGVLGPGYRYEIDATGGRLELVSEFDLDQNIGSANAYALLDVWSTVCVGGAMGVFHAGYKAAQVALFNTFTSKKELCERWDIDIDPDWPCHHVPRYLTSDRGELVSDASEALPAEFNTIVQTAAPYRPEMKGTVEGWFSGWKASEIRKLAGYGKKENRTQRDPKRDAALTHYDAMRAFLLSAIAYNHQAAPKSAIPPQMIEQGYELISRITLWRWGMRSLVPCARIEEPGFIYTSLLRKVDASIRENGLFVEGIRYMSPDLRASGLLQRAAQYGAIDVQATVDDFHANTIWYRTDLDAIWQPAYLADEKLRLYNATFSELAEYYRKVNVVYERSRIEGAIQDHEKARQLAQLSDEAVARKKVQSKGSKSRKAKDIRAARSADAQSERQDHGAFVMRSYANSNPTQAPRAKTDAAHAATHREVVAQNRLDLVKSAFLKQGGQGHG